MSSRRSRSGGSTIGTRSGGRRGRRGSARRRPRACRSRLVAAMTRTSTRRLRVPPTRSNSRSCSTRSSLACAASGSSPISSRNRCRRRPARSARGAAAAAPVKAPFSWPKSSLSTSSRGSAAQFTRRTAARGARLPRGSRAPRAPCRCRSRPGSAPCCRSRRPARSAPARARSFADSPTIASRPVRLSSTSTLIVAFDRRCASISRRNAMWAPTRASSSSVSNGLVT